MLNLDLKNLNIESLNEEKIEEIVEGLIKIYGNAEKARKDIKHQIELAVGFMVVGLKVDKENVSNDIDELKDNLRKAMEASVHLYYSYEIYEALGNYNPNKKRKSFLDS